ncbi:unnamed protein product [Vitrella brassicaformis CCMP3155]|uniref:Uncharacterized protein n=2 Tax=Vitrella brassicaformis TaxID=1169539 RepID=A0A0G4G360_VITBC|nr:unnamed protein product [Vitrella brassicaformis CCMP3155]|mmetsp:Transcript_42632/g.106483  ORF Transcript_42632/g.106483 Transcript_42632/m.106483 type:complete len:386 (+) Transcript_42632:78-1235(+)|eukprot:CEM22678.1 unnamed protein product [Vitrella brassicaformis CCMP3155]
MAPKKKGGKKGGKITGTPDVVKFKGTPDFAYIKELADLQGKVPLVSTALEGDGVRLLARFLNLLGMLGEYVSISPENKSYRFQNHHKYLFPIPQYEPLGYSVSVVVAAQALATSPTVDFNGQSFNFSNELNSHGIKFLKAFDDVALRITSLIEPSVKSDFGDGLKNFRGRLREVLEEFDQLFVGFESAYSKELLTIHNQVFEPIDKIMSIETALTKAEDRGDMTSKQTQESEIVAALEVVTNKVLPETASKPLPPDCVEMAEACLFYDIRIPPVLVNAAKWVVKDFIEVRLYLTELPLKRMHPHFQDNPVLIRVLRNFHRSVMGAAEALQHARRLPKISAAKIGCNGSWMTKKLIQPEIYRIRRQMREMGKEKEQVTPEAIAAAA